MNNEVMNKKLAEWAGFRRLPMGNKGFHFEKTQKVMNWMPPGTNSWWESMHFLPNFTESLDACFEWLVPKLDPATISLYPDKWIANKGATRWCCELKSNSLKPKWVTWRISAETPALALCKAIEKLIEAKND